MLRVPPQLIEHEVWRLVPDYEQYAVSSWGRVAHTPRGRPLVPQDGVDGRQWVALYTDGVRINKYVHQMVAAAFCIGFRWGEAVGHWNGVRTDNALVNLRLYRPIFGYHVQPQWIGLDAWSV